MQRIKILDGLRGVFCIMIVYEHYSGLYIPGIIYNFPLIRHSYIVVDFFFVLSGFILSIKYSSKIYNWFSLKTYLIKRIFRLYPLLFFTSSLFLIFELLTNHFFLSFKNSPDDFNVLLLRYLNDLLLINSSSLLGRYAMNIPSWSISAEFFCYFLFGLILLSFSKLMKFKLKFIAFTVILLAVSLIYLDSFFSTYQFGYLRGAISFLCGVLIAPYYRSKALNFPAYFQLIIVLIFIICSILLGIEISNISVIIGLFLPIFFSFSILVLLNSNGFVSIFLNNKNILKIGEISFSIYLNHYIIVLLLPRIFFQILKVPNEMIYQLGVFILCPIIVIFISKITHKFIEVKLNMFLRNKFLSK